MKFFQSHFKRSTPNPLSWANPSAATSRVQPLWLQSLWQSLRPMLIASDTLEVWQERDTSWHAYDPRTGNRISLLTDADMRRWIEDGYLQGERVSVSSLPLEFQVQR